MRPAGPWRRQCAGGGGGFGRRGLARWHRGSFAKDLLEGSGSAVLRAWGRVPDSTQGVIPCRLNSRCDSMWARAFPSPPPSRHRGGCAVVPRAGRSARGAPLRISGQKWRPRSGAPTFRPAGARAREEEKWLQWLQRWGRHPRPNHHDSESSVSSRLLGMVCSAVSAGGAGGSGPAHPVWAAGCPEPVAASGQGLGRT